MPEPNVNAYRRYTYADYLTWPDDERWELIDGVPYMMSPAPSDLHQDVSGVIFSALFDLLKDTLCKPRVAPQDVRFEDDENTDTIVQPDITVWCKKHKDDAKRELTVVVEVLSPTTTHYDLNQKRELYERKGIPEYWVVSPEGHWIGKYVLADGKYRWTVFESGKFTSDALPGFSLDIREVFERAES